MINKLIALLNEATGVNDLREKYQDLFNRFHLFESSTIITHLSLKSKKDVPLLQEYFKEVSDYADEVTKIIILEQDYFEVSKAQSIQAAIASGFLNNSGRNKRYDLSSGDMYRLPGVASKEMKNVSRASGLSKEERKAVRFFGITDNVFEAGFVLTDGRMLDLSGKRQGAGHTAMGKRFLDHNDMEGASGLTHEEMGEQQGVIRVGPNQNHHLMVDIRKMPTKKQLKTLGNMIIFHNGNVVLDALSGKNYWETFNNAKPIQVINYILKIFLNKNESFGFILEAWNTAYKKTNIFKNPDYKDIKDIKKETRLKGTKNEFYYRILVDINSGDSYIWNGWESLHNPIISYLKLNSKSIIKGHFTPSYHDEMDQTSDAPSLSTDSHKFNSVEELISVVKKTGIMKLISMPDDLNNITTVLRYDSQTGELYAEDECPDKEGGYIALIVFI